MLMHNQAIMSQFVRVKGKEDPEELAALRDAQDRDDGEDLRPGDVDASREAADDADIQEMEGDHPELVLDKDELKLVQIALEKVFSMSACRMWMLIKISLNFVCRSHV